MFQYAFAVALKTKYPDEDVFVDTQHYKNAFVKVKNALTKFFQKAIDMMKKVVDKSKKTG